MDLQKYFPAKYQQIYNIITKKGIISYIGMMPFCDDLLIEDLF